MSTRAPAVSGAGASAPGAGRFVDSLSFDTSFALISFLFLAGLFVDGWAHNHLNTIDTFFTPWHAMFYGGGVVTALFAFVGVAVSMPHAEAVAPPMLGARWWKQWYASIPRAYRWSFWGFVIFAASGLADMLWHIAFGIEASTDALLSPTHLGLASGMTLLLAGPLRAALLRARSGTQANGWKVAFAAVVSLTAVYSLLSFMSQYATPLAAWGTGSAPPKAMMELRVERVVLVELWATVLLVAPFLYAARNLPALPFGWITFVMAVNAALMATQADLYAMIPGVLVAGLCADAIYASLKPSAARAVAFRWFAFAVPVLFWIFHDVTIAVTRQHFYVSVHLWTGLVVIAGLVGLLASFVANPANR